MACNVSNVRKVRKRIEAEPAKRFRYSCVFAKFEQGFYRNQLSVLVNFDEHVADPNGAADIAGWACLVLRPSFSKGETCTEAATRLLGLSELEAWRLFDNGHRVATRADALRRLLWLQNYKTLESYDWHREDGWRDDRTQYET
jgi:hypothetical protein